MAASAGGSGKLKTERTTQGLWNLGVFGILQGFWVEVNEVVYVAMACSGVYRAFMALAGTAHPRGVLRLCDAFHCYAGQPQIVLTCRPNRR